MAFLPSDPAGAASRLTAIFEEGVRIFHEVAQLCVEQRTAVIRNDIDRLGHLTERAETLAARFRLLESARNALMEECGIPGRARWVASSREAQAVATGPETAGDGPAGATARELVELHDARRRLSQAATDAALAAAQSAELLVRASAATSAVSRVLEGAASAGYLPNGELRTPPRSAFLERRA